MDAISLFPFNESALKTLIYDAVKLALADKVPSPAPTTPEADTRLYGDRAAATYLGCTVLTIAKLRRTGNIPYYRYGARYYYIAQELDKALKHEARRFGELRGKAANVK
jgi:hypothetical protein